MLLSTENAIARLRETGDGDTLGGRIWRARDATGLSTKELASKLGVRTTPFLPGNAIAPSHGPIACSCWPACLA